MYLSRYECNVYTIEHSTYTFVYQETYVDMTLDVDGNG